MERIRKKFDNWLFNISGVAAIVVQVVDLLNELLTK